MMMFFLHDILCKEVKYLRLNQQNSTHQWMRGEKDDKNKHVNGL